MEKVDLFTHLTKDFQDLLESVGINSDTDFGLILASLNYDIKSEDIYKDTSQVILWMQQRLRPSIIAQLMRQSVNDRLAVLSAIAPSQGSVTSSFDVLPTLTLLQQSKQYYMREDVGDVSVQRFDKFFHGRQLWERLHYSHVSTAAHHDGVGGPYSNDSDENSLSASDTLDSYNGELLGDFAIEATQMADIEALVGQLGMTEEYMADNQNLYDRRTILTDKELRSTVDMVLHSQFRFQP